MGKWPRKNKLFPCFMWIKSKQPETVLAELSLTFLLGNCSEIYA